MGLYLGLPQDNYPGRRPQAPACFKYTQWTNRSLRTETPHRFHAMASASTPNDRVEWISRLGIGNWVKSFQPLVTVVMNCSDSEGVKTWDPRTDTTNWSHTKLDSQQASCWWRAIVMDFNTAKQFGWLKHVETQYFLGFVWNIKLILWISVIKSTLTLGFPYKGSHSLSRGRE